MTTAYPLTWPDGWPRAHGRKRWPSQAKLSFAKARDTLLNELRLMGARSVVLSTNYELGTRTNLPKSSSRTPDDKGAAIYFTWKKKQYAMACDTYASIEGNMRSLAHAIGHMRGLERHGGGVMVERAFSGFQALPPPDGRPAPAQSATEPKQTCWEILGVPKGASAGDVELAWRRRAMVAHPDRGGSNDEMAELNRARDEALRHIGHAR
ncbi:MAG: J domain-containing protein [Hyphomonadaceae bacterium]